MRCTLLIDSSSLIISCNGDLNVLDPHSVPSVSLINLKSESFVEHQLAAITSGLHESPVMRSIAGAPAFIQLESEGQTDWGRKSQWVWARSCLLTLFQLESYLRCPLLHSKGNC